MELLDINYLARWGHFLFGVAWIGLLYYFNFVQTEYFKEADPAARTDAFSKLAPRALWWFRWGAMGTIITGLVLLAKLGAGTSIAITVGSVLGIFMFFNVWLIIWPNQKIIVESNQAVLAGGEANPAAAAAAPKAGLASRTNTLFSIPMLYMMGASAHLSTTKGVGFGSVLNSDNLTGLYAALALVVALEINAIVGKQGPMTTVRGVIICGLVLTAVLFALLRYL